MSLCKINVKYCVCENAAVWEKPWSPRVWTEDDTREAKKPKTLFVNEVG